MLADCRPWPCCRRGGWRQPRSAASATKRQVPCGHVPCLVGHGTVPRQKDEDSRLSAGSSTPEWSIFGERASTPVVVARVTRWLGGGRDVLFSELGLPTFRQGDPDGERARSQSASPLVEEQDAAHYTGRALARLRQAGCIGAMLWLRGLLPPHLEGPTARRARPRALFRALAGRRGCEAGGSGDHGILRRGTVVFSRRRLDRHRPGPLLGTPRRVTPASVPSLSRPGRGYLDVSAVSRSSTDTVAMRAPTSERPKGSVRVLAWNGRKARAGLPSASRFRLCSTPGRCGQCRASV